MSLPRVLGRIAAAILFIVFVSTSALVLARLAPGDYTDTMRGARLPADVIARERQRLSLDRSLAGLSWIWISGLPTLDFNVSFRFDRPVGSMLIERAPRTAALLASAFACSLAAGVLWGTLLVRSRPSVGLMLSGLAWIALSMPSIVLLFALLLAGTRGWSPLSGQHSASAMALSVIALALPSAAAMAGIHAQALREALAQPWA
ncbi:MAG: hypothetical protein M3R55_16350, partial [Acidobacteriota bacterium]|nr:hypothetical protein [Acidobacteriota bacterium]